MGQSAADRTTARALAQEGQEAFERKDFGAAEDLFARAEALVHAPTLLLALARSQVQLGKLVQAFENYQRVLRENIAEGAPAVWKEAQAHAKAESEAVRPRLAWVTIVVRGAPDPRVLLDDGTIVPKPALGVKRAVNPGDHVITAEAPGFRAERTSFYAGEGQAIAVTLSLEPDPTVSTPGGPNGIAQNSWQAAGMGEPVRGSSLRTWGYVGLGVGAAGVIAGGVTGIMAMSRHSDLEKKCPNGECPTSEAKALDDYRSIGKVSTIAFTIGGAGTLAGITLLLSQPSDGRGDAVAIRSLRLGAGLRQVSVQGTF